MRRVVKQSVCFLTVVLLAGQSLYGGAVRVSDLTEAKEKLTAGKAEALAVLLHGSDWCVSGEDVKATLWDTPAFASSLPASLLLGSLDHREVPEKISVKDVEADLSRANPGALTCSDPQSSGSVTYVKQGDSSWLVAKDAPNPRTDVLRMTLTVQEETPLLRLTAMADDTLPHLGPGRAAGNGNFVITELHVQLGEAFIGLDTLASFETRNNRAAHASDGGLGNTKGWAVTGHNKDSELYVVLDKPLPAGATVDVTIHCLHKSACHTLGRFRWDAFSKMPPSLSAEKLKQRRLDQRNKAIALSTSNYPSVIVVDTNSAMIGKYEPVQRDASVSDVGSAIRGILEKKYTWNALIAAAEHETGEAQLASLSQAWVLMTEAGAAGLYKPLGTRILALDPERKSPWTWRVSPDMGKITKEQKRLAEEQGTQAGVDYLSKMLADPLLAKMSGAQRQELLRTKYMIYRSWKGHQDARFDVLREMVKEDPTTRAGIGAAGLISMGGKSEISMAHGWRSPDLIPVGESTIDVTMGVPLYFHRPGYYKVSLGTAASKKAITLKALSLIVDGAVVAEDRHDATLVRRADKDNTYLLQVPDGVRPQDLALRLEFDAPEDHGHQCHGISARLHLPKDGKLGWW